MSSIPCISHHLFVAAAVQGNGSPRESIRDIILPSFSLEADFSEVRSKRLNGLAEPVEPTGQDRVPVIGGGNT
jgi:hypothetical protein